MQAPSMNTIFRFQFLILIAVVAAFTTFAFASSQTGQPAGGEGVSAISGWTVSDVQYRLADNSSNLIVVEFDLDGSADVVKVSLDSANPMFFSCDHTVDYHWVCTINSSMSLSDVDELRVVATGG